MSRLAELLASNADEKQSRIIWAFDPPLEMDSPVKVGLEILEKIHSYICGVKLNRQLILPLGLRSNELLTIINRIQTYKLPLIMDAKINDIGYTNYSIAKQYFSVGFDAVIVNPFIGWNEGVDQIFEVATELDKDIILLAFMSHKDSLFGYGRMVKDNKTEKSFYEVFTNSANAWDAAGVIVGATYIDKIKEIRKILEKNRLVISPGIGPQGGFYEKARIAGMDYGIVGRKITLSENPITEVKKFIDFERKIGKSS